MTKPSDHDLYSATLFHSDSKFTDSEVIDTMWAILKKLYAVTLVIIF